MKNQNILIKGYSKEDAEKIKQLLTALLPNLKDNRYILVGGISTRYNVIKAGVEFSIRPLNDVDIVLENMDVILPSITSDFLVYHYHPKPNYNGSFYMAFIFPNTKTKVDFFDYSNKPEKMHEWKFGIHKVCVQSAEDQLVNTVYQIQRMSYEDKVDPKQILDLQLLMKVSDIKVAESIWREKHFGKYGMSLYNAALNGLEVAKEHPTWLQVKPRRKYEPYKCKDCVNTKEFPITPMEIIYKLMGYTK